MKLNSEIKPTRRTRETNNFLNGISLCVYFVIVRIDGQINHQLYLATQPYISHVYRFTRFIYMNNKPKQP